MDTSNALRALIDRLDATHTLTETEYAALYAGRAAVADYAATLADARRRAVYGTDVYIRGLIEVSNICKNDCYYCGIRKATRPARAIASATTKFSPRAARGMRSAFALL